MGCSTIFETGNDGDTLYIMEPDVCDTSQWNRGVKGVCRPKAIGGLQSRYHPVKNRAPNVKWVAVNTFKDICAEMQPWFLNLITYVNWHHEPHSKENWIIQPWLRSSVWSSQSVSTMNKHRLQGAANMVNTISHMSYQTWFITPFCVMLLRFLSSTTHKHGRMYISWLWYNKDMFKCNEC